MWPAPTRSGHLEPSSLKKQHSKAVGASKHSSIAISARYVHPSHDSVLAAVEKLGGHNSGDSNNQPELKENTQRSLLNEATGEEWSGRGDLNSRPPAPKAGALHSTKLTYSITTLKDQAVIPI